ncbi:hypothetical protein ANCCAN_19563 [Ancylostoma caninum]|uniref:Thrombospondin type 1 domain protein n=1 Tax=Ancylostoma caninum TaxID=29170 RepID=A0A368FSX3_ANCCA|nr:hypothetical protein ANCCAN_19563 [Ancylostoma caninum]
MRGLIGGYRGFRARFWSDAIEPVAETTEYNTPVPEMLTSQKPFTFPPSTTSAAVKSTKDVFPLPFGFVTEKTSLTNDCSHPTAIPHTVLSTTTSVPELPGRGGGECGCGSWSEWVGECSQPCGGCGHKVRTRQCRRINCRNEEKRPCNFTACPSGTNFLINNGEFHILWRGCCVGLFRSGNECTALETDQNPFLKIISALFSNQDSAHNRTDIPMKIPRGEH